jgi:hypothetical protein
MCNLAKTFAIVAVCLAAVDVATATSATAARAIAMKQYEPYVHVTVPREPLRLGEACRPGMQEMRSCLTAHVVANCPYHIQASFQGLRHERGAAFSPKHVSVAINGKATPIGTGKVTVAQSNKPTTSAGEDVPLDLRVGVMNLPLYPAGRYSGTLVITVMAGP